MENPFIPIVTEQLEYHPDGNITILVQEVERPYPNTALLSMCLMFGCFSIAYFLRIFKSGRFLPGPVRPTSVAGEKAIKRLLDLDVICGCWTLFPSSDPSFDWRFWSPHRHFHHDRY